MIDMRQHGSKFFRHFAFWVNQHIRYLVVSQASLREHNRWIETVSFNIAVSADLHVTYHAQAFNMWIKRTKAVGKLFRQHWNNATGEIYRVTAIQSFLIQRISGLYIMTYISNCHYQAEAIGVRLAIHRVIKIPRRLTVYGDKRQLS